MTNSTNMCITSNDLQLVDTMENEHKNIENEITNIELKQKQKILQ